MTAGGWKRSRYPRRRRHMRRYSRTTASRAIIVCEALLLLSAGCVRGQRGGAAAAGPAEVHAEQPAPDAELEEGEDAPAAVRAAVPPNISASVISLTVATQNYDFASPWAKQRPSTGWATGLVVEGK